VKWKLLVTATLVVAVAILVTFTLPPARLVLETPLVDGTIAGAMHIHTTRSDGRGTPDDVAAAAARAGLKFVVFTDHGDATRAPDPPIYRGSVLCLDAVEISTMSGHYVALDMPAAPYPLGGDAHGVVEDVKRLGGFGIAAHPNSPKEDLSWRQWDAAFDAIEWLNPDTSWRIKIHEPGWRSRSGIVSTLAGYPFRPAETIARMMSGTGLSVDRWRSFAHQRRVVLLAGADAHGGIPIGNADPGDGGFALPIPSYDVSLRTLSIHVRPDRPLTGDATRDATTIMQALRRGHAYTAIDGVATPPTFEFTANSGPTTVSEGDAIDMTAGPVTLRVRSNAPSSFVTTISKDGDAVAVVRDEVDTARVVKTPGIYRAAITTSPETGLVPWILSNPIYVGVTFPETPARLNAASAAQALFDGRTARGWRTEKDAKSVTVLDVAERLSAGELRLRYGLSGGAPSGQYASLAVELPEGAAPYDRVTFTARAVPSLRVLVQFHPLGRAEGWQQSVYIADTDRQYTIRFADARPWDDTRSPHPDPRSIHDILFVVDTTHARPGASGQLSISAAALQH
jgi:hypothetical protein